MRAQFVRGIDPKDSMEIGNKHAREIQKLKAAFKEIEEELNLDFGTLISDDQSYEKIEMVVVSGRLQDRMYSLGWIDGGIAYYLVSWPESETKSHKETVPKLEQAKNKLKEYLIINESAICKRTRS